MKRINLSIFLISFIALAGVITFFAIKDNDLKGRASGEQPLPPKAETITIFVDSVVDLVFGQKQQLYLTTNPSNAKVEFMFETDGIVKIDNSYMIEPISSGQTVCVAKATYNQASEYKNILINVQERKVDFVVEEQAFFVDDSKDFVLILNSNFEIEKEIIKASDAVKVKGITKSKTNNIFTTKVMFGLIEEGKFSFEVYDFVYQNKAIIKPTFSVGFYENNVYDKNSNLIMLYSNISNQSVAQQHGHNSFATFSENLANFNLRVNNENLAEFDGDKIVAKSNGATFVEVFSDIDENFYLKINIVVKSLTLTDFDIYVENDLILTNVPNQMITLEVDETRQITISNPIPSYASFDMQKNFTTSNNNILYEQQQNKVIAKNKGFAWLEISVDGVVKTLNFEVVKTEVIEDENQNKSVVLYLDGINDELDVLNNAENTVQVSGLNCFDVFLLRLEIDGIHVPVLNYDINIESQKTDNQISLRGTQLELGLIDNAKITITYQSYTFILNFVF